MGNIFEALGKKLGLKPPPEPRPVPDLLKEGEFGPLAGQPEATTGVPTFDVMGLGLVDSELIKAKERVVANLRKIGGEAIRAQMFADAIAAPILAVEAQAARGAPVDLPVEPDPVPRSVILKALGEQEQRERMHSATAYLQVAAEARAKAEWSKLVAATGSEANAAAALAAQRAQKEAQEKAKVEWTALAAAGDPAGKAWIEWQKALAAMNYAQAQLAYGGSKDPAKVAAHEKARQLEAAWKAKFYELKQLRDLWIAKQELAAGNHRLQLQIAELEAKRAASRATPPTYHFTVNDNVSLANARKQLEALMKQVVTVTGSV